MDVLQLLAIAASSFLASSGGFWMYLKTRVERRDTAENANTQLLLGISRDRILSLGFEYLTRGWITHDEYHYLKNHLVRPYQALGGNGTGTHLMEAIEKLPFRPGPLYGLTMDEERQSAAEATIKVADQVIKNPRGRRRQDDL